MGQLMGDRVKLVNSDRYWFFHKHSLRCYKSVVGLLVDHCFYFCVISALIQPNLPGCDRRQSLNP